MATRGARGARQAREQLIRALVERFAPGEKLPAEAVLADGLGVSRNTLREALQELQVRGMVRRIWGVGTFMSERTNAIRYTLSDLVPIQALIEANGRRCTAEHEMRGSVSGPTSARQALGCEKNEEFWHARRRYFADGIPVVMIDEYMRQRIGGTVTDPAGVGMDQIEYFEGLGHPLSSSEMILEPYAATAEMAADLDIEVGTLVMHTSVTTMTDSGESAVFSVGTMRTDVLSLRVIRTPPIGR